MVGSELEMQAQKRGIPSEVRDAKTAVVWILLLNLRIYCFHVFLVSYMKAFLSRKYHSRRYTANSMRLFC